MNITIIPIIVTKYRISELTSGGAAQIKQVCISIVHNNIITNVRINVNITMDIPDFSHVCTMKFVLLFYLITYSESNFVGQQRDKTKHSISNELILLVLLYVHDSYDQPQSICIFHLLILHNIDDHGSYP